MINNQKFDNLEIKRGIFQGDPLSPLLIIIALNWFNAHSNKL